VYLVVPPGGRFPEPRRIELGPQPLTIGRAESCDIRVDVPGVDQEHAKISEVALVAMGPDCAVGDVPLDPGQRRLVMPGDEIQIGSIVVALEGSDPSLLPPPPKHDGAASATTQPLLGAHVRSEAPRIRVVEGANFGDELLLKEENRPYVIGRSPKCDLVLDDREVSREHVKLQRKGYTVFVQDQSSTRGSWLGRSAVYQGSTTEWTRPRMLRIGATVLSLEVPEAVRRAAPGAQTSAPMTPPPRTRKSSGQATPQPVPSAPGSLPASSYPEHGGGVAEARMDATPAAAPVHADGAANVTRKLAPYAYDPTPLPAGALAPPPPHGQPTPVAASSPNARRAWKKTGPTIGKASGLLLLALASLAILGALFVVFSLLE